MCVHVCVCVVHAWISTYTNGICVCAVYNHAYFFFTHYRSWGVGPSDMKILFESVGKLLDILMNFFSEVRAVLCITAHPSTHTPLCLHM